jgi:NAD+ synthase (glutamine-hydrolysing)
MRVALCQLDPTVGDYAGNAARIREHLHLAHQQGAQLAVFPELALCGYPPRDLLDRASFAQEGLEALEQLAAEVPSELTALVGFVDRSAASSGVQLHNAVGVLQDGGVQRVVHKRLLPTYDVFDEDRYFRPGSSTRPVEVQGIRLGITVCEDLWNDIDTPIAPRRYEANPVAELVDAGAEVLVNLSASPFTRPKYEGRPAMLRDVARQHGVPVLFVNQVGGNDDLLFDGDSAVYGPTGHTWSRLRRFEEDFAVVELAPGGGPVREQPACEEAAALEALSMGVRDYARKCGFSGAVIGLSGGIDSALTACIAAHALGSENVTTVAMPTRYTSRASLDDARALAEGLGTHHREISIDTMFQGYIDTLSSELDAMAPARSGDVTFENVQARIRGNVLMAISNRCGLLLLSTGNKSEVAVGYATLYGDMAGGLAVISDLPKTFVYRVSWEFNRQAGRSVIPENILTKPPSAELAPDQKDTDSLPAYEELDPILERYVEQGASVEQIVSEGYDASIVERVVRLVLRSEYKRRQMPPSLILSRKAFGPGRRYPIAQGYDG